MHRRLAPLAAVCSALALVLGLFTAAALPAEAKPPPSLTRKALLNAPIRGVCGGWRGHFTNGTLSDAQDYESIRVGATALGNLDNRGGRDGAIVVSCGTRTPYPNFIVAYTANRHGRPVLRSVRSLPSIDKTLDRYAGYVTKFRIRSRHIVARWDSNEVDSVGANPESGVVPSVGSLVLRKGRLRVSSIERQGLRWLTGRFAQAMGKKHYAAATRIASARIVRDLKGLRARVWSEKIHWYYGAWQPGDDRYKGWAVYEKAGFGLTLLYDETADRWEFTGDYMFT